MLQFLTGIKLDQVLLLLKWLGISFLVAAIILMTREHLSTKREIEKLKTTNEELKKDLADKDKESGNRYFDFRYSKYLLPDSASDSTEQKQ